jgi:hypothetical protein
MKSNTPTLAFIALSIEHRHVPGVQRALNIPSTLATLEKRNGAAKH